MSINNWIKEFPAAITVCDHEGVILDMNEASSKVFESDGGAKLIGANLFGCHSEESRTKLKSMMEEQKINVYTIEKNGIKKMIYQSPWFDNGEFKGYVELSIPLPSVMQHFSRD